ncbi:hypothetical protein G9C98_005177 [Cotesia typhae]|uniref:Uncharacterized protein n=1 Tax=Cotesia typhae TaxID=2053667 RepID=A0A8J5VCY0_9HYME|nr:hypothetical protein G9C98_005177 [Cotesia typhae]
MARAGTQRWRNPAPEGDDVQRSIELLDKVLSEYDEHSSIEIEAPGDETGELEEGSSASGVGEAVDEADADADGQVGGRDSSTEPSIGLTPEDESPSLGHHRKPDAESCTVCGTGRRMPLWRRVGTRLQGNLRACRTTCRCPVTGSWSRKLRVKIRKKNTGRARADGDECDQRMWKRTRTRRMFSKYPAIMIIARVN